MDWRAGALQAVAEALLPPVPDAAADDDPAAAAFYGSGPPPETPAKVVEIMEKRLPPEARRELSLLLRLLGSRLGSLLLLGRASFGPGSWLPTSFTRLPLERREAVLLSWSGSRDARLRKAFKALKSLTCSAAFTQLGPGGAPTPLLAAMRYPGADPTRPQAPSASAAAAEDAVEAALVDLSTADVSPAAADAAAAALAAKDLSVARPGGVGSPAVHKERAQLVVRCDVVVVGSGAGGGVAAANLAAAGLRVVVLEKASFVRARDMTLQEGEAFESMYEAAGILSSEDGSMSVLAGATLGGGTRVNWCASFQTPQHVRREWAEQHGLPAFASPEYDAALQAVCGRLGVGAGLSPHSAMCSALCRGLQGAGAPAAEVPRNCASPECSGHCCFGCARGHKQDSVNTWLADACRAGARVITGVWAERVLLEPNASSQSISGGDGHKRAKKAVGVLALAGAGASPLRLVIEAPTVISAAGTLHTPALLLRSGVTCGGSVGANLRLHPCTCVVGLFPEQQGSGAASAAPACADMEDLCTAAANGGGGAGTGAAQQQQPQRKLEMAGGGGAIRSWEGPLMSIFSNSVGDWEGSGYGSLLYTPATHPGLFAVAAPWLGGADFKRLMVQYPNACAVLVLVRDQGCGRIEVDRTGQPRIRYSLDQRDAASMIKGVELGLRSMAAAGAETVSTLLNSPAGRFSFPDAAASTGGAAAAAAAAGQQQGQGQQAVQQQFEAFLSEVAATGVVPLQMPLFSAHQMGTCRLGRDPRTSALDPQGQCWEVEGLYAADGSTFPTPTGVNPMITIESVSFMLTQRLAAQLAGQRPPGGGGSASGGAGAKL